MFAIVIGVVFYVTFNSIEWIPVILIEFIPGPKPAFNSIEWIRLLREKLRREGGQITFNSIEWIPGDPRARTTIPVA